MNLFKIVCRKVVLLTLLLFSFALYSQELPNVRLPSPQTQELNKYINFPVDHSTGVPEISIPLYVIKTKGLEIPIVLNYHASGIKEGQDDGDVGVGWSLSCNYRVSRTIYGHPDSEDTEMSPNYYETVIQNYTFLEKDKLLGRYMYKPIPDAFMPPKEGTFLDGEYDHFNYSVPGQGGTFIISDRINKTISEFNPTNNKFSYLEGVASNNTARGIIGFNIKDDNQNVYSFGEQIDKLGSKVLETNRDPLDLANVTAWALTDIDTKYGEKIKFTYNNKNISSKYKKQVTINLIEAAPNTAFLWEYNVNDESLKSDYSVFALSAINTPNERIEFLEQSNSLTGTKIQQINIYDIPTGSLIKRIELYYRGLYLNNTSYVFLDSIKIYGKSLGEYQKYSFNYYDGDDYSPGFLTNNYFVPDQWGFNKAESSPAKLLHNELGNDFARPEGSLHSTNRLASSYTLKNQYPSYFTDRKENISPEIFSLRSITYPTGGKTVYEYEPNKVEYGTYQSNQWGGIRIKSIKHYDGKVNQYGQEILQLRRDYTYGENGSGTGYPAIPFDHNDFRKEYVYVMLPDLHGLTPRRAVTYSSNMLGDLTNTGVTYYTHVTEHLYSDYGSGNGKIIYQYDTPSQISADAFPVEIPVNDFYMTYYQSGPKYVSYYNLWDKPLLKQKSFYSSANALLKKELYTYINSDYFLFKGLKVRPFARVNSTFNESTPGYYFSSFYNHGLYYIEIGNSLLSEKEEIVYTDNGSTSTVTSYAYNDLNQIIKETTTDSKNQTVEKNTVYPADIPYSYTPMRMLQANDVNKILEQSVKRNNTLLNKVTYDYSEMAGEIFVPNKIKQLNTATQGLEDKIIYHRYDSKGNVLSVSKANDVVINYIWSYKGQFPIAEIKGPDYETVENILGAAAISQFSAVLNPQKSQIDNFLAPLRTAINSGTLPDAELVSFSYDPLIGIKSQTDARGKSVYYDYDAFGRLKVVKDDNESIEKKIEYHYRNE